MKERINDQLLSLGSSNIPNRINIMDAQKIKRNVGKKIPLKEIEAWKVISLLVCQFGLLFNQPVRKKQLKLIKKKKKEEEEKDFFFFGKQHKRAYRG